ncbi:MAG: radical SAM family heme chaperone HemW [Pirellulales bacterium]
MSASSRWIESCRASWGWHSASSLIPRAAYLHVPFCHHRCGYCNFTLIAGRPELIERYLHALERELSVLGHPFPMDSLFVGGGTPSMLTVEQWGELASSIHRWLPPTVDCEWSIEANPCDVTIDRCLAWRDSGVNRISIGGQSFQDRKLQALDRSHTSQQLHVAIDTALRYFSNVSIDLIFAAPLETVEEWHRDLDQAIQSGIHHVSTYGLTYEKGTRFWTQQSKGLGEPMPQEQELRLYQTAIDRLIHANFEHYEVSNFARSSKRCRHNETYWLGNRWFAFGPGAARFVENTRSVNHRSTTQYLKRMEQEQTPVDEADELNDCDLAIDQLVFGLRRMEGISWAALQSSTPTELRTPLLQVLEQYCNQGWLVLQDDRLRLTRQGLWISDSLWPRLYALLDP